MTITPRLSTTKGPSMDSMRKTALVAGVLYLLTFISSIPAVFLQSPVLNDPTFIISSAGTEQVRLGALFDIVNCLTAIGTAVALYAVIKRQNQGFAIGFVSSRLFEGTVLMIGVVSILSIVTLQQPGATGAEASLLVTVQQTLVTVRNWAFVLGTGVPALNAFLLGWLMYKSRLVPRAIPVIGLIGAPLFTSWIIGYVLGVTDAGTAWHGDRGRSDLHLGAVARPVDDLQGLPQGGAADGRGRRRVGEPGRLRRPPSDPPPASPRRQVRHDRHTRAGGDGRRPAFVVRTFWVLHRAAYRVDRRPVRPLAAGGRQQVRDAAPHDVGRRSGQTRVAIVGYYEDGPNLVTLAMNGWGEKEPAWWLNLQAQPDTDVELPDGTRAVRARAAVGRGARPAVGAVRRLPRLGRRHRRASPPGGDRQETSRRRPRAASSHSA